MVPPSCFASLPLSWAQPRSTLWYLWVPQKPSLCQCQRGLLSYDSCFFFQRGAFPWGQKGRVFPTVQQNKNSFRKMSISIYKLIFKRKRGAGLFAFLFLFNILTFMLRLIPKSYSEFDSSLLMGQTACKLLPVSTAGLIATNPPQQIYRPQVSALLHPPHAILPTSLWAKGMRASESRTQRYCPVLNAMVLVVSSQAFENL